MSVLETLAFLVIGFGLHHLTRNVWELTIWKASAFTLIVGSLVVTLYLSFGELQQ